MYKTKYLEQFKKYVEEYLSEKDEIQSIRSFNHSGPLLFHLWLCYNQFANRNAEFDRIPHGNDIFQSYEERHNFLEDYKNRIKKKYESRVKEVLENYQEISSKYINYIDLDMMQTILEESLTEDFADDSNLKIAEAIYSRNREVIELFINTCLKDYQHRIETNQLSDKEILGMFFRAEKYNGYRKFTEEGVFKMIVNADEYFSNIGSLDSFFSGLADSIVEYIKRQEVMEDIKNGTKTAADLSAT